MAHRAQITHERRSHILHELMQGAHVSAQRVFRGEDTVTDGADCQLAVQLHMVVEALAPAEHLPADAAPQAAKVGRRRACGPPAPHCSVDRHRLTATKHHPQNGHDYQRRNR